MLNIEILAQGARIVACRITGIAQKAAELLKAAAAPAAALNGYARQQAKALTRPPSEKGDYVRVAGSYVSKRFLGLCAIGLVSGAVLFATAAYPWMEGRLWTPTILLNSAKMASYTGPARIKNDMGVVIYQGDVEAGRLTGTGVQYDAEGELVYSGQFLDGSYEGQGSLYENGVLRYQGQFVQGLFEGVGTLYDSQGRQIYQGEFVQGSRQGEGTAYDALGAALFSGTFLDGSVDFISWLGAAPQDIAAAFGEPGYTVYMEDGRRVLAYLSLGAAFVCADGGDGGYLCDRVLVDVSEGLLGVGEDAGPTQLEELLGPCFSSLTLELTADRAAAFHQLSLKVPETARTDKYRMSNYYIKAYYDAAGGRVAALECGSW